MLLKKIINTLISITLLVIMTAGCSHRSNVQVDKKTDGKYIVRANNCNVIVISSEDVDVTKDQLSNIKTRLEDSLEEIGIKKGDDLTIKVDISYYEASSLWDAYNQTFNEGSVGSIIGEIEYLDKNNNILRRIKIDTEVSLKTYFAFLGNDEETEFVSQVLKYTEKYIVQ